MPDGNFRQVWHVTGKILEVVQVQVVACVHAHAELMGFFGRFYVGGDCFFGLAGGIGAGVGFSVEFYAVGTGFGGGFQEFGIALHEKGGADAMALKALDGFLQKKLVEAGVPAGIGGKGSGIIGHKGDLIRFYLEHQVHEGGAGVPFYVEFGLQHLGKGLHVGIADVAFVGPGMYGDALGPVFLAATGGQQYIGAIAAARVAQGGNFIDVYGKLCHCRKDKTLDLLLLMRTVDYLLNDLKPLDTAAEVEATLSLMEEYKVAHLPVLHEKQYVGLVCEDNLLDIEQPAAVLEQHINILKPYQIRPEDHLYDAVGQIARGSLTLLPVVEADKTYLGYLSPVEILQDWGRQITFSEPGSMLVLRIEVRDYHLSQLAQIVESEDARIVGFQMNSDGPDHLRVSLKINEQDCSRIIKSLERYEYQVLEVYHQSLFDDSASDRYESLMRYLNT